MYSVCTLTEAETTGVAVAFALEHPAWGPVEEVPGSPWVPWGSGALLLPQAAGTDGMALFVWRAPSIPGTRREPRARHARRPGLARPAWWWCPTGWPTAPVRIGAGPPCARRSRPSARWSRRWWCPPTGPRRWPLRSTPTAGFAGLVITTGGTGFGPRDLTPEGTRQIIEAREAPGLAEAMRLTSPRGLPRGIAGTVGQALVLNVPGSPKGAVECLEAVADVVPHALALLAGDRPH